jgi:hypothetical protein
MAGDYFLVARAMLHFLLAVPEIKGRAFRALPAIKGRAFRAHLLILKEPYHQGYES